MHQFNIFFFLYLGDNLKKNPQKREDSRVATSLMSISTISLQSLDFTVLNMIKALAVSQGCYRSKMNILKKLITDIIDNNSGY